MTAVETHPAEEVTLMTEIIAFWDAFWLSFWDAFWPAFWSAFQG